MKYLLVDSANILYRTWSANAKNEEARVGLCVHSALFSMRKWINKLKPDKVVFVFEGGDNWRKKWTASEECVSGNQYKAHRVYDPAMEQYFEFVDDFRDLIQNHSALNTLQVPGCEGDDVIAGFIQLMAEIEPESEVVVLSSDRDFIQLKKFSGVTLIDPATGSERDVDLKTNERADPVFYLFEKCIRGDGGDGVFSAFPRVRKTRIRAAFEDEYERVQLMNETWEKDGVTYRVGDLFEENKILVDLSAQPEEIRATMYEHIYTQMGTTQKFSNFHFMRFLGKYNLMAIKDDAYKFVDILSGKL